MATRSLSPHQITQRLLKHRAAVATLALYRSMQIVKDALRRQGRKVSLVPARVGVLVNRRRWRGDCLESVLRMFAAYSQQCARIQSRIISRP